MRHAAGLTAEDRLALADLVHRYAAYVDAGDVADVVALFTQDAVMVVPEPPERLGPVVEHHRDRIPDAMAALASITRTVHEIVGEVYDATADPDRAGGLVKGVAHHVMVGADGPSDVVWRLRYADDYRRTPDGWRFARRELTIDMIETRPVTNVRE
jgi:ketosteroid isomerase-like protein